MTKLHTPTSAKLVSSLALAVLLPLVAWSLQKGIYSWQVYQFQNAPLERFYDVLEFEAHDVVLSESSTAVIEMSRKAAGDYLADAGLTLEGIVLKDTAVCCVQNFERRQAGVPIAIERGEQTILIEQDLNDWFATASEAARKRGAYQWVFDIEVTLPYGVKRRVTYTSNVFKVVQEPTETLRQL